VTLPDQTAVIAVGGNALIREGQQGTIAEQFENARSTAAHVGALVAEGWRVVLTHGNGPQVGFILRRSEMATEAEFTPRLTLDMCVADSEGGIGYIIANSLLGELGRRGMADRVACVLTQTVGDSKSDPGAGLRPGAKGDPRAVARGDRSAGSGGFSHRDDRSREGS